MEKKERKYFGKNACLTLFEKRRKDIIRVYVTEESTKQFGPILKWCAKEKKAYHVVTLKDVEKISETTHHENICIVAKEKPELTLNELAERVGETELLVFVDDVENPHNVGAMIRTCAHFGVKFILMRKDAPIRLSGVTARIAEGGAESVEIVRIASDASLVTFAKKLSISVLGSHVHKGISLYARMLPRRSLLLIGNEAKGISASLEKQADVLFKIPGTGAVESLNVATATGLFLGEFWRQHRSGT